MMLIRVLAGVGFWILLLCMVSLVSLVALLSQMASFLGRMASYGSPPAIPMEKRP